MNLYDLLEVRKEYRSQKYYRLVAVIKGTHAPPAMTYHTIARLMTTIGIPEPPQHIFTETKFGNFWFKHNGYSKFNKYFDDKQPTLKWITKSFSKAEVVWEDKYQAYILSNEKRFKTRKWTKYKR